MKITKATIRKAEKVLKDNGIAKDEAATVLQALGYVLMDAELYPESGEVYVKPDRDDILEAYKNLTGEDQDKITAYSAKIRWAFTKKSLKTQIMRFRRGDVKDKAKVFYLLEDCNYHDVAGLLLDNKIEECYKWIEDNM